MDNNSSHDNLSARVRRTLEDLNIIRESLIAFSEAEGPQTQTEGLSLVPPKSSSPSSPLGLDLELAGELKSMVDALRQLLWAYIQALSSKSGRNPQEVLSWYKMELAVQMLRGLRSSKDAEDSHFSFESLINSTLMVASHHIGEAAELPRQ